MIKRFVENNLVTEKKIKEYLLNKGHKKSQVEKNIDKFNWFINYLFYCDIKTKNKDDNFGYFKIDGEYVYNKLGMLKLTTYKNKFHRYITECLVDLELIQNKIYNNESYLKLSEYRFTKRAKRDGFSFLKDEFKIGNKSLDLDIQNKNEYINYLTPLLEQTKENLKKLTINKEEVVNDLQIAYEKKEKNIFSKLQESDNSLNRFLSYSFLINNIICMDYNIIRKNNKGRMFNFFSSTPKLIRPYYRFEGEELIELDINNCVPSLILEFLDIDKINKDELNDYIESLNDKKLHKDISKKLNIELSVVKTELISKVFFDKEKKEQNIKKYFKNRFPTIHKEILRFKNNYKNYADLLYEKEGEIMIDNILHKCFILDIPVISLHDALFTNKNYIEQLKQIVDTQLEKVTKNIKLKYKIK